MDQQRFLECRAQLMSRLELSRDMSDSEILDLIDELIAQSDPSRRLRFADRYQLKTELFNSVRRLDILQELLDDDTVTEIMVNGMGSIYIERAGRLMKWEKSFTSREKLQDIIQTIVSYSNRVANESVPIRDHVLPAAAKDAGRLIFLQHDAIFLHVDLQLIFPGDAQSAPQLDGKHDPAEAVHLPDDTGRFHV